jgi:hypothetical protein
MTRDGDDPGTDVTIGRMIKVTPFVGPHGSFWVKCGECDGRGWFWADAGCTEDGCETEACNQCRGNTGYWDCVDDLCAALIDEWNGW